MPSASCNVLIVEDDARLRRTLTALLDSLGHSVVGVPTGLDALAYLRSDVRRPDLILLDLRLPGMDGFAFRAEQLRDPRLADIRVVVMTALDVDPADVGALPILRKPLELEQVRQAVQANC